MRRLVLQFRTDDFLKSEHLDLSRLRMVKRLEFLQILERGRCYVGAIIRVSTKEDMPDIEKYMKLLDEKNILKTELLEKEEDGAYILFTRYKVTSPLFRRVFIRRGVYSAFPNIQGQIIKVTFFGSAKKLRSTLEELEKLKMHFKVISLTNTRFASESPLNALTEKQRRVLTTAYALGYYDLPRRIDSEQLARRLNLSRATLVVHRRKAERRILTEMIEEGNV